MQSYLPQNAANQMILRDFYVNDLLTGADTVEEAIVVKRDIETLLQSSDLNYGNGLPTNPQLSGMPRVSP